MKLAPFYKKIYLKRNVWIMSIRKTTRLEIEMLVGQPKGWVVSCINGKREKERGIFPSETCEQLVVRGTILFCNNKLQFFLLEKVMCGMFKCDEMNNVEGELFHFQLCFINCEIVLTFWTYVLIWMFSSLFCDNFHYE